MVINGFRQSIFQQNTWLRRHTPPLMCNVYPRMSHLSNLTSTRKRTPTLPRLPIPSLHNTLEKYLKSIEPLLLEDARNGGIPFEEARFKRAVWAKHFEEGLGSICQQRLLGL